MCLLVEADFEGNIVIECPLEEAAHDQRQLNRERHEQEVEADAAVAVALEKGHDEAEAEHGDCVHIRKHYIVINIRKHKYENAEPTRVES